MHELFALACCNRNLCHYITKNIELCVNDELEFFKNSCDQSLKGYVELEARLNSIGSSYEITKLENENFEVRPTLDIGRHDKLVFIVEPDLIRAVSRFRVEVP